MYTYEQYCKDLDFFEPLLEQDLLNEGVLDYLKGATSGVGRILAFVKNTLADAADEAKVGGAEIVKAFKDRNIFKILKAFKFSIQKMLAAVHKASSIIHGGVIQAFKELHKTKAFQKIKSGAMKIDEVLDKYPVLKKLTGPIVAGILIYTWLNMTFVGNFDYDMDIGIWFDVLMGKFSITELFASPEGMAMLAFLATGMLSGGALSVAWLGSTTANLATAVTYAALKKVRANQKLLNILKSKIQRNDIKESTTMQNFKSFAVEQAEIEESIKQIIVLQQLEEQQLDELFAVEGEVLNEAMFDKILHKAGLHVHKGKGLIQYLASAGKGIGKLLVSAVRGDKEGIKAVMDSVTKEDVLDFLLKLDTATLHLVSGPLHTIDAVTGWHIWAAVKDKAEGAKSVIQKIKQALKSVKDGVTKIFTDKEAIAKANQSINDLETSINPLEAA